MQAFISETAVAAPLEGRNIDTDQIIPARFLKEDKDKGYGRFLFHDLRFDEYGAEQAGFVLNQPAFRGARILVTDVNFGCGSSREGAAYALAHYGIRAIVAPSFGDIFYNNAMKNGMVPVRLDDAVVARLRAMLADTATAADRNTADDASLCATVDLEHTQITLPDGSTHAFEIDSFWRDCLLQGKDEIGLTQDYMPEIERLEASYAQRMPWLVP